MCKGPDVVVLAVRWEVDLADTVLDRGPDSGGNLLTACVAPGELQCKQVVSRLVRLDGHRRRLDDMLFVVNPQLLHTVYIHI